MKLYYTAPPDECFEELKNKCVDIWQSYDDEHGYATSKISVVKGINNFRDNFMHLVAMFDMRNQAKLASLLSPETRLCVRERMYDGGQPDIYNPF